MTQSFRLGDLCHLVRGESPTLKTEVGAYPLVVTAAYRRTSSTYQLEGPTVCIPLVSSTGHGDAALHRIHYQDGKFALADLLVALQTKDNQRCDAKYLYYLLLAKKDSLFVPLMKGTANVSLKERDIANVHVSLPSLAKQKQVVEYLDELSLKIQAANTRLNEIGEHFQGMLLSAYNRIVRDADRHRLGDVAPLVRRPVLVDPFTEYPGVSVRSFGKGTFHNPPLQGCDITWERPQLVHAGDILISNIKAWEGAIAVAKPEDDSRYGSHRYLTYVPLSGVATSRFICFFLLTSEGLHHVGQASPGSADRNRTTSAKVLLEVPTPVPAYKEQIWFGELFEKVEAARELLTAAAAETQALLPAIINQIFNQQESGGGQ